MTKSEILYYLSEHKDDFSKKFDIVKLGLFGSFAKNNASTESDIDILIELKPNSQNIYQKKKAFKNELENFFHRKVDVAREKYLNPRAKESIMDSVTYV